MMNAYNNNDKYNKTLNLFNDTKKENNICMNGHSFSIALCAAGYLVSQYQGSKIIDDLYKPNNKNILQCLEVQSAIISMYAKCSNFEAAINIFNNIYLDINKLIKKDKNGVLYLFGAIMDCYAKIGNISKVLLLYNILKKDKQIKITKSIYCTVLNACSHSGLININQVETIFDEIKCKYNTNNIHPHIITAMIDCFGRKNCLDKAEHLYKIYGEENVNMYHKHKLQMLLSLLSSCRIHGGDTIRSQRIFNMMENIVNKYETDSDTDLDNAMHILLSNIYGKYKDFDKVNEIRKIMKEKGLKRNKKPGISWIEINGKTHRFRVNDKSHSMYNEIEKEREIIKNELKCHGHIYDNSVITRELNEDENIEDHLCGHSEKSALIYGLIMTKPHTPIVIAKNLRICKDCHAAIALISNIRNRKIKVRDKNRWHIFENGKCSCNDYF